MTPQAGARTLGWLLGPLEAARSDPATTEITITRPGRFAVERDGHWSHHDAPELTFDRLEAVAVLTARLTGKTVGRHRPRCTSIFPTGERVKIMLPPLVPDGTVGFTIRRRALHFVPTLCWLTERDYFADLDPGRDWPDYWARAVGGEEPRTVVVCGMIGSSKTTFAEALLRAKPLGRRIVTVEGSPEWMDLPHPNWQPYFFDESDPSSAALVVQDAMQSRPDDLCFQELRGGEAWGFNRALKTGTPGVTTVHAPNARRALMSIATMIRQSPEGRNMDTADVIADLRQSIGIIAHCTRTLPTVPEERTRYRLTEVLEVGATEQEDVLL